MNVILDKTALSLETDELAVYVFMSFHVDKDGYVYGTNKELATMTGMSVPRLKKAIDGLFAKKMISTGNGKVFIWNHENNILFSDNETPVIHREVETIEKVAATEKPNTDEVKMVCDYFNKSVVGKGMPQIKAITQKRKTAVSARLKEYGFEQVISMIDNAASSPFLNGEVSDFMASFDWIMRPNNFTKVLEGNYNGRRKTTNKSAEQDYYQGAAELMQRLNTERERDNAKQVSTS